MARLIFRNDDVSGNSDFETILDIYSYIREMYGYEDVEIYSCVNLLSERNTEGSVYKDVPFKNKKATFLYKKTNDIMNRQILQSIGRMSIIVSHGLYHVDHSAIGYDAQTMSIVGSCRLLNTNIFVPPFNRFNEDTEQICKQNKIELVKPGGWLSMEFNKFTPTHAKWYFHSWRYDLRKFKDEIGNRNSKHVGQLLSFAH